MTVEVVQPLRLLYGPATTLLAALARTQIKNYRGTVTGRVETLLKLPALGR